MAVKVNPWDQQRGESSQAFAAFRVYLEMGPDRSHLSAYRLASGRADAEHVPGCWRRWLDRHDWTERARAWDGKLTQQLDRGLFREAQSRGERIALALDQAIEETMAGALKSIEQGQRFLNLPTTVTEFVDEQGRHVTIKPADARTQRFGAMMLAIGLDLAVKARDLVLAQIRDSEKPEPEIGESSLVMDKAARDLEAWRARQRQAVLDIPDQPPGDEPAEAGTSPPPPGPGA